MKTLTSLAEVSQILERHEQSARIKKLLFCVCKNYWENDPALLDRISWQSLVQDLHQKAPSLEKLSLTLEQVVKTLNKRKEYTLISHIIIDKFQSIYANAEEPTQLLSGELSTPLTASPATSQLPIFQLKQLYDSFELRIEVAKYISPLKAKIFVFSLLHHKFTFSKQDWLILKTVELDDLLLNLVWTCEKFTQLEATLNQMTVFSEDPECNGASHRLEGDRQVASAILQALKPIYRKRESGQYQPPVLYHHPADSTKLMSNPQKVAVFTPECDGAPHRPEGDRNDEDDDDNEATCQFFTQI